MSVTEFIRGYLRFLPAFCSYFVFFVCSWFAKKPESEVKSNQTEPTFFILATA